MIDLLAVMDVNHSTGVFEFVGEFSPLFGVPVLAGVIERPFYTAAGVKSHTVWWSIQANVVAALASCMGSCFQGIFDMFRPAELLVGSLVAVVFLAGIKCFYLRCASDGRLRPAWPWVFAANATSVVGFVLFARVLHWLDRPHNRLVLQPLQRMPDCCWAGRACWPSLQRSSCRCFVDNIPL